MDKHKTYDKERVLKANTDDKDNIKKKPERFIWSYIIRPVRKDYDSK